MRNILLLVLILFADGIRAAHSSSTDVSTATSAHLVIQNRSSYKMFSAVWGNGTNCTSRLYQESPVDINKSSPLPVAAPAGKPIAVGVAIYETGGKAPVLCDYIVSFTLNPGGNYRLEFDVHDRRCFGQLFRQQEAGNFLLISSNASEGFVERFPEFGWDQFEPGCSSP